MKSPRRAGVAGGVGEGEVVTAGGVLDGDAAPLSDDAGLGKKHKSKGYSQVSKLASNRRHNLNNGKH